MASYIIRLFFISQNTNKLVLESVEATKLKIFFFNLFNKIISLFRQ